MSASIESLCETYVAGEQQGNTNINEEDQTNALNLIMLSQYNASITVTQT